MINVLLIEPNRLLSHTYSQALEHAGFEVVRVASAQAAIDAADKQTPDIVLLELRLSAHNGVEFLQEFRSYAEWRNVPVIVNTVISPTVMDSARQALQRDFGVGAITYKPRTGLQDLIQITRDNVAT